jgi:hypothetical protein
MSSKQTKSPWYRVSGSFIAFIFSVIFFAGGVLLIGANRCSPGANGQVVILGGAASAAAAVGVYLWFKASRGARDNLTSVAGLVAGFGVGAIVFAAFVVAAIIVSGGPLGCYSF